MHLRRFIKYLRLGWKIILWPKLRMGLLQEGSAGLNAKLCDQRTQQISTYHPCAFGPLGLVMKYPRELQVVLLFHNLGVSIGGVHIGSASGWDVEICGVLCHIVWN